MVDKNDSENSAKEINFDGLDIYQDPSGSFVADDSANPFSKNRRGKAQEESDLSSDENDKNGETVGTSKFQTAKDEEEEEDSYWTK